MRHSLPLSSSFISQLCAKSSIELCRLIPPISFRVSELRPNKAASNEDFQAGILLRRVREMVSKRKSKDASTVAIGTIIQTHWICMYRSKELDTPDTVAGMSVVVRSLMKLLVW